MHAFENQRSQQTLAEGIAEYRVTLQLQPRLYEAELNAAILLLRQKDPVEALPLLEDAAAQKPREFRAVYFLAEAQSQTGALDKALESVLYEVQGLAWSPSNHLSAPAWDAFAAASAGWKFFALSVITRWRPLTP